MKNSLKVGILLFVLILMLVSSRSFAANIDMGLANNVTASSSGNGTASNGTTSSSMQDNTISTVSNTASGNSQSTASNTISSSTGTEDSAIVSSVSSLPESELGLTNILNILLIAVGVILIFLAIAILIRLGKN